jgi:hypothetical protein
VIRQLRIINYRSFEDAEFALEPLTVFIGPVGAGKSNVLKAIEFLANATWARPAEAFGPYPHDFWSVRNRAAKTDSEAIALEVSLAMQRYPEEEATYRVEIAMGKDGPLIARDVLHRGAPGGGPARTLFDHRLVGGSPDADPRDAPVIGTQLRKVRAGNPLTEDEYYAAHLCDELQLTELYHLEATALRAPSGEGSSRRWAAPGGPGDNTVHSRGALSRSGKGLGAALLSLRDSPATVARYEEIVTEMRGLLPGLRDLLLPPSPDGTAVGFQYNGESDYHSAFDESDGTLFTLGLLTIIRQSQQPRVLMIEEPETGLHPGRLRWLVDELQDASDPPDGGEPTQVLISTHSPYVLDQFVDIPECVRVVERVAGRSRVTPLLEVLDRIGIDRSKLREDALGRRWYAGLLEGN